MECTLSLMCMHVSMANLLIAIKRSVRLVTHLFTCTCYTTNLHAWLSLTLLAYTGTNSHSNFITIAVH